MDFQNVIIAGMGFQDVEISDIKLFKKDLRAEIYCRQKRTANSACHRCKSPLGNLHDWYLKKISGPPFGIYQHVVLKIKCFRAKCGRCSKNVLAHCTWIHPKHRSMSCGFAEVAGRLMEETTCRATARWFSKSPMQMLRLDQSRMKYMLQFLKIPEAPVVCSFSR